MTKHVTSTPQEAANLLTLLGRPAVFYPNVAKVIGLTESVLLHELVYWLSEGRDTDGDGWVDRSVAELEKATALSYKQQITARANLRGLGLVEERHARLLHRLYFRVNWTRLDDMLATIELSQRQQAEGTAR